MADAKDTAVEYREIPGWPRYLVGSDGTVWTNKIKRSLKIAPWKKRVLCNGEGGYLILNLANSDGYQKSFMVHRLVSLVFFGPTPEGLEICHNNGIKTDNRVANLRWDTHAANIADAVKHGAMRGAKVHRKKYLTEEIVKHIRAQHEKGLTSSEIAREVGCNRMTVFLIVNRRTWKHVA